MRDGPGWCLSAEQREAAARQLDGDAFLRVGSTQQRSVQSLADVSFLMAEREHGTVEKAVCAEGHPLRNTILSRPSAFHGTRPVRRPRQLAWDWPVRVGCVSPKHEWGVSRQNMTHVSRTPNAGTDQNLRTGAVPRRRVARFSSLP